MYSTCLVLEIQDTLHVQYVFSDEIQDTLHVHYVFSAGDTGYTTCTVRV